MITVDNTLATITHQFPWTMATQKCKKPVLDPCRQEEITEVPRLTGIQYKVQVRGAVKVERLATGKESMETAYRGTNANGLSCLPSLVYSPSWESVWVSDSV